MTDKYRVHEIVKFDYSDIGEYIDEYHTDRPLRNDILVELLNGLAEENRQLKYKNELLSDELEQCKAVIDKKWSDY